MKLTNISLKNLGTVNKNKVEIETDKGYFVLYFSYETIVGIFHNGETHVIQNYWSNTTGKLLNELEPNKKARLTQEEFDAKLAQIFA